MFFPNPKKWILPNPLDPVQRIDQELSDRRHRLTMGLSIAHDFGSVLGALVITEGHGKYLRLKHAVSDSFELPDAVRDNCLELVRAGSPDFAGILAAKADLSRALCPMIETLKQNAGKYVDRLLLVSINDPGLWFQDFDDQVGFSNWIDPVCVAELTGITTLDAFPTRDMAVGGSGQNLNCLPLWLMMADRSKTISDQHHLFLKINKTSQLVFLPASDGLEAEVPKIQSAHTMGRDFLDRVLEFFELGQVQDLSHQLNVQGQTLPRLLQAWRTQQANTAFSNLDDYLNCCRKLPLQAPSAADIVRTSLVFLIDHLHATASRLAAGNKLSQVFIETPEDLAPSFVNQIDRTFESASARLVDECGLKNGRVDAAATAVLGLLNIDQMPANIPWITNAESQRILGRLTPGRPSNWRQVLREMADFQPPAMRLRDAI
ncbi:MAG: anhydro-N-acetylmuramic acid kinase [Mariniblastus sp.]|nr:anhydro-N-acetylmuramic acid kinase [Mariniblastus sp.]